MKKVTVVGMYRKPDQKFGASDGGTAYGNLLLYPETAACRRFEGEGIGFYSESELPPEEADMVLCADLTPELYERMKALPRHIFKILQACESVIYAPLSHAPEVIMDPLWDVVMTWNRGFEAPHVVHYDIAFAGRSASGLPETLPSGSGEFKERGVVIASNKGPDHRGYAPQRNRFYLELAKKGFIDLYGHGWSGSRKNNVCGRVNDKIAVLRSYSYALVIENIWGSGYVTEKIADCILGGIPVIYMGDSCFAQKRFPGCFVPLEEISFEAFTACREKIRNGRDAFQQALAKAYANSDTWCDSYIAALAECFRRA